MAVTFKLRRLLISKRSEVCYSILNWSNCLAFWATRFLSVRLVWQLCSSEKHFTWKQRLPQLAAKALSSRIDTIIAVSDSVRTFHTILGFRPKRWEVIANGIDTETFSPDPASGLYLRKEWQIEDEAILIGSVGRITPVKGHVYFLKTAAELVKAYAKIKFVVVGGAVGGESAYRKFLKTYAAMLKLEDHLIWAGERHDMPEVYNALNLLMNCSSSEGGPTVIAEAMACGIPCVATDVGDCRNMIGDCGQIVPSGSALALEKASLQMIENLGQNRSFASKCRRRIENHFSLNSMVQATEAVLASS